MVVLDGVCYQVRHDGSMSLPDLRQRAPTPWSGFVLMIKRELPQSLLRKSATLQILDDFTVSQNYIVRHQRFTASSDGSTTHTVIKQESPTRR